MTDASPGQHILLLSIKRKLTFTVRLFGILLVLLAAYNMFSPLVNFSAFPIYPREKIMFPSGIQGGYYYLEDAVVIGIGGIIAYLS